MTAQEHMLPKESSLSRSDDTGEDSKDLIRLRNRDSAFLAELFSDINPRLLRMIASKGIFAESAEEIVHDCWETFFLNLDKFEGRSKIRTFVFGILVNKLHEHRRRINRIDYEEDSEKVFERSFTKDGWWVEEPSDPYKLLANQQLGSAIQDCLEGLSDSQRAAFLLIESEGESSESACTILGISISNLRVLIFRAKDKLRTCLEGQSYSV